MSETALPNHENQNPEKARGGVGNPAETKPNVTELVHKYENEIPQVIRDNENCQIDKMARLMVVSRVSGAVHKLNGFGSYADALGNTLGNLKFEKLAKNKNLSLVEFFAVCLEELEKQKVHAESRSKNTQKIDTAYQAIKTEIGEIITNQVTLNKEVEQATGKQEVIKITGGKLLAESEKQKWQARQQMINAGLFTFGVVNVASGAAIPLVVAIPLLRFLGIMITDFNQINAEKLSVLMTEATKKLEKKLKILSEDLDKGYLTKAQATQLETILRPFISCVSAEGKQDLLRVLTEIQYAKSLDYARDFESNTLKEILAMKKPTSWDSWNSKVKLSLNKGWTAKIAWNLVQVTGLGIVENVVGNLVGDGLKEVAGKVGEVASQALENVSNIIPQIPEILQAPINKMAEIPMGIQHTTLYNSIRLNGWNMDAINQYLAVNGVNNSAMADQIGSIIDEIKTQTPGLSREQILQKAMPEIAELAGNNGYDGLEKGTKMFLDGGVPNSAGSIPSGQVFESIVKPGQNLAEVIKERKFTVSIVAAVSTLAGFAARIGKRKEAKLVAGTTGLSVMAGVGGFFGNPLVGIGVGAGAVAAGFVTGEVGKRTVEVAQKAIPEIQKATGAVAGVTVEKSREFAGNAGQYIQEARANTEEVIDNGKQYIQGVVGNTGQYIQGLTEEAKTKFGELTQGGNMEQRAAKYKTQLDELKKSFEILKQNSQINQELYQELETSINQLSSLVHHFLRATNSENQSANPSSIPQPKEIAQMEAEIKNLLQKVQNSLKLARKPNQETQNAEKKKEIIKEIMDFRHYYGNFYNDYRDTDAWKTWRLRDDIGPKLIKLGAIMEAIKNKEVVDESEIKALLKDLYKAVKKFEKSRNPDVDVLGKLKERAGQITGGIKDTLDDLTRPMDNKLNKIIDRFNNLEMEDWDFTNAKNSCDEINSLLDEYYGKTTRTPNGNTVVIEPNKSENLKNEIKAKLAELEKLVTDLEKNRKQQKPKSQEPTFLDKLKERAKRMAKRHAGEKKRAEKEKKKEKKSIDKEIQDFFKKLKQVAKDYKAGEVYKKWIDSDSVWPKFLELTDLIGANTQLESMIQEKEAGNPNDLLSRKPGADFSDLYTKKKNIESRIRILLNELKQQIQILEKSPKLNPLEKLQQHLNGIREGITRRTNEKVEDLTQPMNKELKKNNEKI
jgi:hypothetical protein